ncbi:MAG: RNase H family protein [Bacteroidota bacterium]
MNKLILFTDGSVDTQSKIGFGAYLFVEKLESSIELLKKRVKVKRFENTSSTKLELQILLWALKEISEPMQKVTVYSDSQNIIGLPGRRARFEQNDYRSKKNEHLKNYKLYREFYQITDKLNIDLVKVNGHQPSYRKDEIDKIFTIVDRASRNALRGK